MRRNNAAAVRRSWARWPDERLLDMRLCDLGLRIERTPLAGRVRRLHAELERRGLRAQPHVWLSSEWFSPDGIPGIAAPFYLAHPRVLELEAKQMLEVEGRSDAACMQILRHEAGHAIDTAYRLHLRARWREVFGRWSQPYPRVYRPRPNSRNHVLHLGAWYAQAHPAEDFAETFAVWLAPRSSWRQRYKDWPRALRKLEYVDQLMQEIGGRTPPVTSRARVDPLEELTLTLRSYYRRKRERYAAEWSGRYDRELRRLFSDDPPRNGRPTAAAFLRSLRGEVRGTVAEWTGAHTYTVDQVLRAMIERCRTLKLRLAVDPRRARTQAILLLTAQTMRFLYSRRHEIAL
ncbi:MAG TPA: putative zinc-binding metallopeptidase [Candidatus Polarisedimenticolaceae bacterium]|nr:putative zinc-binding metallopeptidase [Candidatus Polarisedimenticolaceae bacterium]